MQALTYSQLLFVAFSGLVLMSGCQKPAPANEKDKVVQTAKPTPSSFQPTTTATKVADTVSPQAPTNTATTEKIDITQAIDINRDADFSLLKYLFIAQNPKPMTDEEKMALVSREYVKEIDGFKKKDLATQLLPKINAEAEKYKGQPLIKIPVVSTNMDSKYWETLNKQRGSEINPLYLMNFGAIGQYDFKTHAFPLYCFAMGNKIAKLTKNGFGNYEGNPSIGLSRAVDLAMPKDKCELVVTDETLARKIESAQKGSQGFLYAHFTVEYDRLILNPVYANIDYYDMTTGEVLATKELHW